jgi:hypothetical protein
LGSVGSMAMTCLPCSWLATTFCCSVDCNLLLAWALARKRWMASMDAATAKQLVAFVLF